MIYERITEYCKNNGLTIMGFEQKCGLSNGTVGKWRDDKSKPSLVTISKIASVTGIAIEEWIK